MANAATQIHDALGVGDALFQKQLKGDADWSELANTMEPNLKQMLVNVGQHCVNVTHLVASENLATPEFLNLSHGIMRDLQHTADTLNVLVDRRGGRTGPTKSAEEYTDYMTIGLEMSSAAEQLQTVVTHAMFSLTEYEHEAMERRRIREESSTTQVAEEGNGIAISTEEASTPVVH